MALNVRTDETLDAALTALAQAEGTSKQEVIRRAVLDRYARAGHREDVAAATDRALDRWSDVLRRLGEA